MKPCLHFTSLKQHEATHNFVLKFHTHSPEQHQLPISKTILTVSKKTSTEPPLAQSQEAIEYKVLTHLPLGRQGYYTWLVVRQLPMKAGWWDASLTLWDLAEAISITRSTISHSFIQTQPLLCTSACGYEFHAFAVQPHSTFTAPPVKFSFGIRSGSVELFCWNSLSVKVVGCFPRGAPSLMFDGILNVTLYEEKISTTGVTHENLKLLLRSNSPDSHQTQI